MSVFNLEEQNRKLDYKIVAGLERLSQAFRMLLWEKAKEHALSPIQIQLLIFIEHHSVEKTTISYLAQEFNFTKPTISDAIKVLEQKQLLQKMTDSHDTRSYTIQLTEAGKKIVTATEDFTNPVMDVIAEASPDEKLVLWDNLTRLISRLNQTGVIRIQRTCFKCRYFSNTEEVPFCNLLNQPLYKVDIRMDCGEFEPV